MAVTPPPPIVAPNIAPYKAPPPFGYVPPSPGTFTGKAPTAKPVGAFTGQAPTASPFGAFSGQAPTATPTAAFDPSSVKMDGGFDWRLSQGLKGLERGAASHGSLLTGGTLKAEQDYGQNAASQEYQAAYQRALQTYGANRDTNAQNFNLAHGSYQDALSGYGANRDTNQQNFNNGMSAYDAVLAGYKTNRDTAAENFSQDRASFDDALSGYKTNADVTLASGAQGLQAAEAGYDRNTAASDKVQGSIADDAMRKTGALNATNANAYQAQMLQYAQQQEDARRQQETVLQDQERMRQYQQELEARNRQAAARQNAAYVPGPSNLPTLSRYTLPYRQAGAGA